MPKSKFKFVCQSCGYESPKWLGRCPDCNAWNSFVEETSIETSSKFFTPPAGVDTPKLLSKIDYNPEERVSTSLEEIDRVLGGGIVPGSVVLIGGEPGIGKSTLLLQISHFLAVKLGKILYVSGEESSNQIRMRAERLGVSKDIYVLSETNVETIEEHIKSLAPKMVIIDSVQTLYRSDISSAPGSVSQVRESSSALTYLAKGLNIALFLVGHVTKDGAIAGPRILEHLVDTVLYFEGDRNHTFRILRAYKNRFGSTNEIGIFEMGEKGLSEVANPSAMLLAERTEKVSGTVVVSTIEGTRPMLVEVQALVSSAYFSIPQRRANGIDYNRFSLLVAVLEKRAGYHLGGMDIFVNVAGGIKVIETAVDLGVIVSIASGFKDKPVSQNSIVIGEVGLGGEVRTVPQIENRIQESARMGFKQCIVPYYSLKNIKKQKDIEVIGVKDIKEALKILIE